MRSTKERDKSRALRIALSLEKAGAAARAGELTRAVALRTLEEMVEASTGERLHDPSVREFLTGWLGGKGDTRSAGTAARYRPAVKGFLLSLGQRADRSVRGITAGDLENYRKSQTEAGKSNGSANLDIRILRIAFDSARRQGLIVHNPADAVEALPADDQAREPFSDAQLERLLSVADDEWQGMILFGTLTGLRLADAAGITWKEIDLAGEKMVFTPGKTKRHRKVLTISLHPDLLEWLESQASSDNPRAPVFPTLHGRETGSHCGLSNAFRRLMEKAGVVTEQTRQGKGKGRSFNPLSFHSCRHTFVTNLANSDVSQDVRKAIAGHSCDRAHERYTHLSLETQKRALANIRSIRRKSV